ncbi:MAG: hypothetical protein ABEJ97_01545 [Halobellus sp.]
MSVVEPLPSRPLGPQELLEPNSADALDLAVPIEDEGRVTGVLVATESWVKGLALGADTERVDGLQACEAAVLRFRGDDPDADEE